jgi:NitT/TauT family transport system substrate-binding protein
MENLLTNILFAPFAEFCSQQPISTKGKYMDTQRRRMFVNAGLIALGGTSICAAASGKLPRVAIAVPGPGNLLFLPITLAHKIGADGAEGIELDILYVGGGPQAFQEMLNRNADFSAGGLAGLGLQKTNGKPVVCIAPTTRVPAYTLVVRKELERSVKTVRDLKGKVVGVKGHVPGGRSTSQLFTEFVLTQGGVSSDKVNYVAVGQAYDSQQAALLSGTVDAIMGDEPFASRLVREKAAFVLADFHSLEVTKKLLGGLFLNGQVATRDDVIADQPEKVGKVVNTLRRALLWINSHTAQQFVDALEIDSKDERSALLESLLLHKNIYSPDGKISLDQVATVSRFLHAVDKSEAVQALDLRSIVNTKWSGTSS